jgi:nucleotide-binding universal stress UspA family protein
MGRAVRPAEGHMKNILLIVHDDPGQEARLQAALDVTRAVNGYLTCLDVSIMPVVVGDYYSEAGEAMLLAEERAREATNRERLEARLAHEDVSWDWIDVTGDIAPCVTEAAALADLIVTNRKLDGFALPDMREATGEIVVKSGRPILAVPDSLKSFDPSGRALIAWDGSPCATAALHAAVPLLQLSRSVILFEVEDGSIKSPAEEAAAYLSRHGIHAAVRREACHDRRASDILLHQARHGHVAYVVMGGFGHRRFIEALFGGVTRKMLTESPIPLFMAH